MAKEKKPAQPKASKSKERKKCKTDPGVVKDRILRQTLAVVERGPIKRHRNDYNSHMAAVRRLAKLL